MATYGYEKTIGTSTKVNIEIDKTTGQVVACWFRCFPLPFDVRYVDKHRAEEMRSMSEKINQTSELLAVDVETDAAMVKK